MTNAEIDDRAPNVPAEQDRRSPRRKRTAVGAIGLAAVLGAGGYLATTRIDHHQDATVTGGLALRPVTPLASPSPAVSPSSSAATGAAPSKAAKPSGTARTRSADPAPSKKTSVAQEIADARAAAARDGHPLRRPLTTAPGAAAGPVTVTNQGSLDEGGTVRVVSARYDLTGRRELLWAADQGKPVGGARCTQNFRFSDDAAPEERPSMLLCWRTSASRSVVTVAVVKKGRPATAKSAAIIDRRWAELG